MDKYTVEVFTVTEKGKKVLVETLQDIVEFDFAPICVRRVNDPLLAQEGHDPKSILAPKLYINDAPYSNIVNDKGVQFSYPSGKFCFEINKQK